MERRKEGRDKFFLGSKEPRSLGRRPPGPKQVVEF